MQAFYKAAFMLALLSIHAAPAISAPGDTSVPRMLVEDDLIFEDVLSEKEHDMVKASLDRAKANIIDAYGERKAPHTDVIWCKTKECAYYFGGPTMRSFATEPGLNRHGGRYTFRRPAIVILRQAKAREGGKPFAVETMTHELSHRELRARLNGASIPAWFNEGVATYIGKDQTCTADANGIDQLSKLADSRDWLTYTDQGSKVLVATYCQARNEVARWIQAHDGFAAVLDLLAKRAQGASFQTLYGR